MAGAPTRTAASGRPAALPEYSVLMPLFYKDRPDWFKEALCSVAAQTVPPTEIVIVYEYELPEKLIEVIDGARLGFPEVHFNSLYDPSLRGKGLGGVLSRGLEACSCKFVARMDSDDISVPTRCEEQLVEFRANPSLALVGAWVNEFEDDVDDPSSLRCVPETTGEIARFAQVRNPINHPVVMYRKTSVLEAGNYAELPRCEDYELWVRMLSRGMEMKNVQKVLLHYRISDDQRRRRKDKRAHQIRLRIKRGMFERGEIPVGRYAVSLLADYANYYAPMALFVWGTKHLIRSSSNGGKK